MVDATEAKELALLFIRLTKQEIVPRTMGHIISSIKKLMEAGYSSEELDYAIRTIIHSNPNVYSFGYIAKALDDVFAKKAMEELKANQKEIADEVKQTITNITPVTSESEVVTHDETTERNKRKAERIRELQSRKRAKPYFNLFER